MTDFYKDKVVLVTGGTGSIGSEIVKKLIKFQPKIVRVLDNNETALFELEQELNTERIRTFIGDIRDKERLKRAFENVDIVFHAGALKHVSLCEFNPFDAVKTNVLGTQNVLNAALDMNVKKVITISTDKAVNPINVMGATKLLAERLTISANHYVGDRNTVFSCVRFGNVLDSRGSVVPIFKKQIEKGGPLTITDPEMTRFVMSIPEAVDLILQAGEIAGGNEIFILKMPALNIVDLAEVMIEVLAPQYGFTPDEIKIEYMGKRLGEKMFEELMTTEELTHVVENGELFVLNSKYIPDVNKNFDYNSHLARKLSKDEIKDVIGKFLNL
ncbi:UDP-N-acetylglucosamine 4,6-dehydratase family protein [Methanobacterium petrolearium]|uniref:UDP-N-acetylglucosamine 4,6-dehydratase family protein n=1 Tax=Methanobacterium petrolearium TaxID=710190 RepID=UPI001AE4C07E|nr:UDP-N-acetylglucosamine 4,6-dehydratase family protein [Methanobacterium petrolearium]MBP1945342.1 FlaA1/EpsC-like NDP-sugar epimerase [Methanobacterium petrolearium]BDZ71528.1 membrane protein [Methanobacterium petrolearium]